MTDALNHIQNAVNNLYDNNNYLVQKILLRGFTDTGINQIVWLSILKDLIKIVQLVPNLQGKDKQTVIVQLVIHIIDKDLESENKDIIKDVVNELLPLMIETLVDLWKEVDCKRLLKKCLCC